MNVSKYRLSFSTLIVSIWIAGVSFFTDKVFFDMAVIEKQNYVKVKIIYVIAVMLIGQILYRLYVNAKKSVEVKQAVIFSGVCFGMLFLFLCATYPGIWLWDNMEMLQLASRLNMSGWHGYYMQWFFVLSLMLIPIPVGVNVIQIIIISAIMGRVYFIVAGQIINKRIAGLLLLFLLLPANLYWSLMAYRTAFFGFLCGLAVLEFITFWKKQNLNPFYAVLLYGFVWNIRSEGYALLLLIPFIAYKYYKQKQKKTALLFLTAVVILTKIVSYPIPSDRNYLASAIMNPLENMIKCDLNSDNLSRDLEQIDKVFSVEMMKNSEASPLSANIEGAAWYKEGFWDNIYCTKEDWNNMLKAYCNIVYFNPQLFLKLRAQTMYASVKTNKSTINEISALTTGAEGQFGFDLFVGTMQFLRQ